MRLTCTAFAILVTVCTWTGRTFFPDLMSAEEPNVSSEPGSFSALVSSCGIETIGFENGPISGLDVQDSEVFAVNTCDFPGDFLEQKFEDETGCTGVDDFPVQSAAKTSVDAVVSRAEYNRILFEARMNSASDLEMKMPWEKGIMKQIFDSDDDSIFPATVPAMPSDYFFTSPAPGGSSEGPGSSSDRASVKSLVRQDLALPFYSFAVKVLPDRDLFMEETLLWNKAIKTWLQIFEILGFPGMLGASLFAEPVESEFELQSQVLRDTLGIKSPRTAIKRGQTMLKFFNWLQQHFSAWDPWNRSACLQYIGDVGSGSTPVSRGITFLEALRFSRFVMEIPIPDNLLSDPQLKGRARRMMAAKEQYHPARPLKAKELATLEMAMASDMDVRDTYMLGAVIFAILSRSRWSDLKFVDQFWVERADYNEQPFGFVEARTKFHKTATSLAKKQRHMPLVAPILGVTSTDWSDKWVRSMLELKVVLDQEPFGAICRAPAQDGSLCRRSCTTKEVGDFVNRILQTSSENFVTSHSFKHTTLSWCSSYGLDEVSRTLLGHHELQGAKAMTVYSRDMLTRPLQLYCSMLANIRNDHFRPDESRTSRMVDLMKIAERVDMQVGQGDGVVPAGKLRRAVAPAADEPYEPTSPLETEANKSTRAFEEDESSDIASTSSSSSESDGSSEDVQDTHQPDIPGPVWRNKRSHVVHKCSSINQQTACGRLISSATFELLELGCSSLNARCSRCFKGEVITTPEGLVTALDQQRSKRLKKL